MDCVLDNTNFIPSSSLMGLCKLSASDVERLCFLVERYIDDGFEAQKGVIVVLCRVEDDGMLISKYQKVRRLEEVERGDALIQ